MLDRVSPVISLLRCSSAQMQIKACDTAAAETRDVTMSHNYFEAIHLFHQFKRACSVVHGFTSQVQHAHAYCSWHLRAPKARAENIRTLSKPKSSKDHEKRCSRKKILWWLGQNCCKARKYFLRLVNSGFGNCFCKLFLRWVNLAFQDFPRVNSIQLMFLSPLN